MSKVGRQKITNYSTAKFQGEAETSVLWPYSKYVDVIDNKQGNCVWRFLESWQHYGMGEYRATRKIIHDYE